MDLAGAAGLNRVTISKIERGFADPGVLTVLKLLNALGLEANDLLIVDRQRPKGHDVRQGLAHSRRRL